MYSVGQAEMQANTSNFYYINISYLCWDNMKKLQQVKVQFVNLQKFCK